MCMYLGVKARAYPASPEQPQRLAVPLRHTTTSLFQDDGSDEAGDYTGFILGSVSSVRPCQLSPGHLPVPGREGVLSLLTPEHRHPCLDTMQYVQGLLPLLQTLLLLLLSTLLLCQQDKKPAGCAHKAPSFS